jgi:hypothetical protein
MSYQQYQETSEQAVPVVHDDRAFLHTYAAAAFIPFVQASITGVLIGICILVVLWVSDNWQYLEWSLVAGVVVWAIVWVLLQTRWLSLTAIERVVNMDINNDGYIGDAPRDIVRVQINQTHPDGRVTWTNADLPASLQQLSILAAGLINGLPFAEAKWSGAGKPFSLSEFRALRDEMIARGLLAQANTKDIRQGYTLTAAGRAVMKHYAPSPALMLDDVQND